MKNQEDDIVKIAKALSDKTRIHLLKEIASKGSISCGDAEKFVELAQPTVSHHLKILTDSGLIIAKKSGRHISVTLNKNTVKKFVSAVTGSLKIG
jgi:ArsR family transcriptional regulator